MAQPGLNSKMTLDGEAEYKKALSSIGAGLKVLKSEMQMTTAEFASNASSVEALSAKNDVLERQISSQKEKIETLQGALKNSATLYGESDKKTMDWQKSLYSAQAELSRMEASLKANNDALKEAESGEAQYKEALESVNEDLKTLKTEMNKTTAEFASNASSVEALSAKNAILNQQIETQQQKVETLRSALKNSAEQYGATDGKTKTWQQSLNDAEAELSRMEASLKANNDALKEAESGEAQYKEALESVNEDLKTLKTEMNKTTAEFANNSKSVEALSKKNEVLNRQIETQQKKVDTLRAALKNSAEQYGATDSKTKAWQQSLNDAEAELAKMDQALQENNKSLEDAQEQLTQGEKKFVGLGDSVETVAEKLGVKLPSGATKALNSLGSVNTGMVAAAAGAAALAAALVKVEQGLVDMTKESAAWSGELHDLADVTGIAMEQLQEYDYAAELAGTTLDTMTNAQTKLIKSMQSASDGAETQLDAFQQLGVAYADIDGQLRDTEEVFWDVVTALGNVDNATQADSLAMELLGKSARELNPLIKTGKETFDAYTKEAKEMGLVLEDDALDALDRVDDAMLRLNKTTESTKNQLSAQFAPSMEKATEKATEFINDTGKSLKETGIVENFGTLLEAASGLLDPMADLIDLLGPTAAKAMKGTAEIFAVIADTLDFIVGVLTLDGDKVSTALGLGMSSGNLSHQQKIKYADSSSVWDEKTQSWIGNYTGYNAAGDDNWRGGWTYINEAGPELALLPKGTQIYSAQETRLMGGDTYNITIDASSVQEFNDIVEIVKNQKRLVRMGVG